MSTLSLCQMSSRDALKRNDLMPSVFHRAKRSQMWTEVPKMQQNPSECQKPLRIFRIQKLLFGLVKIIRKQLSPLGKTSWCFSLDPQKIVWLGFGIVVGTVKLSSLWFPSRCLELSPPDSKTVKITEKR